MKDWWQSKTIWVNIALAAVAVLVTLQDQALVKEHAAWLLPAFACVEAVINSILRVITSMGIRRG